MYEDKYSTLYSKYPGMCVSTKKNINGLRTLIKKQFWSFVVVNIIAQKKMDLLYQALSQYRRRQYDKCVDICTAILDKQPLDQAAWCLKIKALTQRVYVDDLESEDTFGTGEESFDENVVATAPRVGTSMVTSTASGQPSGAMR